LSNDIRQRLQIPVVNRLLVPLHWKTISKQKQVPSKKFIFKSTLMIFKDFYFSSTIPINQLFFCFSLLCLCLCLSTGIASPSQSPPMEKKIKKTGFSFPKNSKNSFGFFSLLGNVRDKSKSPNDYNSFFFSSLLASNKSLANDLDSVRKGTQQHASITMRDVGPPERWFGHLAAVALRSKLTKGKEKKEPHHGVNKFIGRRRPSSLRLFYISRKEKEENKNKSAAAAAAAVCLRWPAGLWPATAAPTDERRRRSSGA
jgi:hypothetical protein